MNAPDFAEILYEDQLAAKVPALCQTCGGSGQSVAGFDTDFPGGIYDCPDCPTIEREDGYCLVCGNGHWKPHHPYCELADALDRLRVAEQDADRLFEIILALNNSFANDPRDWGNSGARDAWRYGVICGWGSDDEELNALGEIAEQFPTIDIFHMERLHSHIAAHAAAMALRGPTTDQPATLPAPPNDTCEG